MLLLFLWIVQVIAIEGNQPEVETDLGRILGFQVDIPEGHADVFLGIPFAQPPVGKLRFEKPLPVQPWTSPLNATKWGHECVPHILSAIEFEADEDCLTLNIIRPSKKAPPGGFPVLVFIHGGGFEIGSARVYGYQGFAEAYAFRNVISVTVQYRIGVMGWLSTENQELPGNFGLWDLAEGLRFIHKNIASFGGNPNKITIWGQSAGASAVGQLMLSPQTRDIPAASIEMSGTAWSFIAIGTHVVNSSLGLMKELNCTENVKNCMKGKSVKEIDAAVNRVGSIADNINIIKWGPILADSFFGADLETLSKEAKPKPVILGLHDKDAAYFTVIDHGNSIQNLTIKGNLEDFDEKKMVDTMRTLLEKSADYGSNQQKAIDNVIAYYLEGKEEKDDSFYINQYTQFCGDVLWDAPGVKGAEIRRKAGWPIYFYKFEHYNDAIWKNFSSPKGIRGSVHLNEFAYMIDLFVLGKFEYNEGDKIVKENSRDAIANFAKTGVATWSNVDWQRSTENLEYISIKVNPEAKTGFYKEAADFWRFQTDYGYDLTSEEYTNASQV